jgi:hypothetical protein
MPIFRDDSSPLEAKRRQLAQQERLLAEKRRQLKAQLESGAPRAAAKMDEPPVWRMEDEHHAHRFNVTPAPARHLARQRQRDRYLFFALGLLLMLIVVLLWMAWIHNSSPAVNA